MALPITTKEDYKGFKSIPTNRFTELTNYIAELEPQLILEILNANSLQGIEASTIQQKYTDLINGGYYTNSDDELVNFRGLKEYLLNRIYALFIGDNFTPTQSGNVKNAYENSIKLGNDDVAGIVASRYNKAVEIYEDDILPFLEEFEEIRTTATGSTPVALPKGYTINVPSTKYLYDGDTVKIDGKEYVISNLVADTSFDIEETIDSLDFTGSEVVWYPFYDLTFKEFNLQWYH